MFICRQEVTFSFASSHVTLPWGHSQIKITDNVNIPTGGERGQTVMTTLTLGLRVGPEESCYCLVTRCGLSHTHQWTNIYFLELLGC